MKKILTMAAVVLLAAGCSNDDERTITPEINQANAPVAIQLSQSVAGLSTKAPVVNGTKVNATVVMADVTGNGEINWGTITFNPVKKNTLKDDGTFNADADRANVATATFTVGEDKAIVLNPALYHASTDASWVAAVAPDGNVNDGTHVNFSTINGLQDVMFATAVSTGTKSTQITDASLKFEHLMTQLQFAVKYVGKQKGEWNGKSVSVKTIEILNAQLPKAVHFSNGQVDLTDKATFSVPSIITSGLDPKATAATTVSPQIMINPSTPVIIDVTFLIGSDEVKFSNVTIGDETAESGNLAPVKGSSHLITLTLNEPQSAADSEKALTVKATVTPWNQGNNGSATIND